MKRKKLAIFAQGFSLLLTLGVGILIGARSCATIEIQKEEVTGKCSPTETIEKIVYECPPKIEPEKTVGKKKGKDEKTNIKRKTKRSNQKLPKEKNVDPNKRRRLLAFVRSKSKTTLAGCRGSRKEVYRLTVNIVPKEDGSIRKIKLSSPPGEVPASVLSCLKGRMKNWKLPSKDVVEDQPIIWGLKL